MSTVFSACVLLLRHVHLRPSLILRVHAHSVNGSRNTSHAVTRPRMAVELVVAHGPRELLVLWSSSVAVIGWNFFSDRTSPGSADVSINGDR